MLTRGALLVLYPKTELYSPHTVAYYALNRNYQLVAHAILERCSTKIYRVPKKSGLCVAHIYAWLCVTLILFLCRIMLVTASYICAAVSALKEELIV